MRRREVVYASDALNDLETMYDIIADASDPTVAAGYEHRIRAFCDSLAYGAERGSLRDDLRPEIRAIGFERRVSVAFTVEDDRVVVLRLFYGGRHWTEDLR